MPSHTPTTKPPSSPPPPTCRLLVVGASVRALVSGDSGLGNYAKLVGEYRELDAWLDDSDPAEADVVVASAPTLFADCVQRVHDAVERGGASHVVLVYDYAQAGTVAALADHSRPVSTLRAPVTAAEIKEACEAGIALATLQECSIPTEEASEMTAEIDGGDIPPRQFSDEQLAKVSQVSTDIDCECPHHLASLISTLNAFENYSRECESRDEADAIIHSYLHRNTARARASIEESLVVLAEAEGFVI